MADCAPRIVRAGQGCLYCKTKETHRLVFSACSPSSVSRADGKTVELACLPPLSDRVERASTTRLYKIPETDREIGQTPGDGGRLRGDYVACHERDLYSAFTSQHRCIMCCFDQERNNALLYYKETFEYLAS